MKNALQQIGRALMVPVAVLPAAGLVLRLGQPEVGLPFDLEWLVQGGEAIFHNLPLIFAISIAIGLTADAGLAGLSAAVGYLVFKGVFVNVSKTVYGAPGATVDMGVLAGILAGLLAARLHARFRGTVLLRTTAVAVVAGVVFGLFWYWPEQALAEVGHWMTRSGAVGAGVHAGLNRLLLPLGLHHVINNVTWYEFGDLTKFGPSRGADGGLFTTGFFPIMMFGLPGAALAIYRTAAPEKRRIVGGLMLSAGVTSFVTGVTEPIEFAFMFSAPVLYLIHGLLSGAAAFVTAALGVRDGFSFSAGLVDYVLNYGIATKPLVLLAVGVATGVAYYVSFKTAIERWDLATLGREPAPVAVPQVAGLGAPTARLRPSRFAW